MIVSELIKRLEQCDPAATVYLADWQEAYQFPDAGVAALPLVSCVAPGGCSAVIMGLDNVETDFAARWAAAVARRRAKNPSAPTTAVSQQR